MKTVKYAFLNLKGHYRGDLMLEKLIVSGFLPSVIIEEESPLAEKSRATLWNDLELKNIISFDFKKFGIEQITVANHNDDHVAFILKKHNLDFAILGDCRILKRQIFDIPKFGTINVHPGYLPIVRGNTPYIWALMKNLPQGCTAHFIDDGIDTGDIISRSQVFLTDIKSYKQLIMTINDLCADIIVRVIQDFLEIGAINSTSQISLLSNSDQIHYFTLAPDSVKQMAKRHFS